MNRAKLERLIARVRALEGPNIALEYDLADLLTKERIGVDSISYTRDLDLTVRLIAHVVGVERVERVMQEAFSQTYQWARSIPDYRQRLIVSTLAALLAELERGAPCD